MSEGSGTTHCVSRPFVFSSLRPTWTVLSLEFSRQEYCSGLPFPSPGDLPKSGIKPKSPTLQAELHCPRANLGCSISYSSETMGRLVNLFEPDLPHLYNGDNDACLLGLESQ